MVALGTIPKGTDTVSVGIEALEEDRTTREKRRDASGPTVEEGGISVLTFPTHGPARREEEIPEYDSSLSEVEGPTGIAVAQPRLVDRRIVETPTVPYVPPCLTARQASSDYMGIMRAHFVNPILDALRKVQPHARSSGAAMYIDQILQTIRQMEDHLPDDPLLEVLFALYDALAFNGRWAHYTADQYAGARELVKGMSERLALRPDAVEKAIIGLEDIGFDTTPYSLDMEEMEEEKV